MSSRARTSGRSRRAAFWITAILGIATAFALRGGAARAQSSSEDVALAPGGFLEKTISTAVRPLLTPAQINAFLPARGKFTFPAPYNTTGVRLTNASDCGGADCVNYVGYSYWRNINNHVGSDTMLIMLSLNNQRGGGGPTLFSYNKVTDQVQVLGPLFDPASRFAYSFADGWYWSASRPNVLYFHDGPRLLRYDVMTRQSETVLDSTTLFGPDTNIFQHHSSNDDLVHSATLRSNSGGALGCMAYREDTRQSWFYPVLGDYDECQIDKSGRWLLIKDNLDGQYGEDDRIINLETGAETRQLDQNGAAGHSDMGYGYMVAADNYSPLPNTVRVFEFGQNPLLAPVVYHNLDWSVASPNHLSHCNARPGTPIAQQYACGSSANRINSARANEVICFRLDTSLDVMVVAPVMTDMNASGGGDDYGRAPKGNLDVTGQYFIWTSNMGGGRLDAFLVKVPSQLLIGSPDPTAPTVSLTAPAAGASLSGSVTVAATASDDVAVIGVQFRLDGAPLGIEDLVAPYSVAWDTTTAGNGTHTLTAVARDLVGNATTSAAVNVTVANGDTTAPAVSISAPLAGATLLGAVAIGAAASDNIGVTGVQFKVDGLYVGPEDTAAPFAAAWDTTTAGNGPHTLTAVARDLAGNTATSAAVSVTVANPDVTPPIVSLGAPAAGAVLVGTVALGAAASDNLGVAGVQFRLDGAPLGAEDLVAPYAIDWDTTTIGNGAHVLTAAARDATGNVMVSLGVGVSVNNPSQTGPDAGLVGAWKFEEGAGASALDDSGRGHSGTLRNGTARVPGRAGSALAFDGLDDYVSVGDAPDLDPFPLSVVAWVRTSATGIGGLVNKYAAASRNGYQLFLNGGTLCAWYFRDASRYIWDGSDCTLATPGFADDQWHQVAFVVDAAGGRLYVDGQEKATQAWTGTPGATTTAQALSLGQYPGAASPFFAGGLDDVRLFARALTASDVAALFADAPEETAPPLIGGVRPVAPGPRRMTITWTTDVPSDSQVEYCYTPGCWRRSGWRARNPYAGLTPVDPAYVTSHSVTLQGLLPNRVYHYRVRSKNAAGQISISPDQTFRTPRKGSQGLEPEPQPDVPVELGAAGRNRPDRTGRAGEKPQRPE